MSWETVWQIMAIMLWAMLCAVIGVNTVITHHIDKSREDDYHRKVNQL